MRARTPQGRWRPRTGGTRGNRSFCQLTGSNRSRHHHRQRAEAAKAAGSIGVPSGSVAVSRGSHTPCAPAVTALPDPEGKEGSTHSPAESRVHNTHKRAAFHSLFGLQPRHSSFGNAEFPWHVGESRCWVLSLPGLLRGLHSTFGIPALPGPLLVPTQQPQGEGEEEEEESRATAPRALQLQLEHRDSPGREQWLGRSKWG